MTLESLSTIEITSVSRKEQKLIHAAGAIFVITNADIRRSGLTSIAELLRTVPGIDVAEIDANKWSIIARGFGERYPDKMLVMLDGRTLYSPLTSGITWDIQETLLEDIDRIEVIRGPGATLWGANAVNGVVNIITRKAKDSQGVYLRGAASVEDRDLGAVRYGGTMGTVGASGPKGAYRTAIQYLDRDGSVRPAGASAPDRWHDTHGSLRADWDFSAKTTSTIEGDLHLGGVGTTVPGIVSLAPPLDGLFVDKTATAGGDLIVRWSKTSRQFDTMAQAYLDIEKRNEIGVLGEYRHTIDLELVERFHPEGRHDILFGGDFRDNADRTVGSLNISFNPASRATQLYGVFAQDEISLLPDRLKLTLGSKLEHNFYSGVAFQPNFRMILISSERTSTWMAISRASESSSRTDADVRTNENLARLPDGVLTMESDFGKPHLPPEDVLAFELGNRFQPNRTISFDLATFYNHYTNRHTDEPEAPYLEYFPTAVLIQPTHVESNLSGETHGAELLAVAHLARFWDVSASYSLFQIHLHPSASSLDFQTGPASQGSTPRQKAQVHSLLTLPHGFELDSAIYCVGKLEDPSIDRYERLDIRVGWQPSSRFELSAGGKNLLQASHYEFPSGELVQSEPIGRSASLTSTWRF